MSIETSGIMSDKYIKFRSGCQVYKKQKRRMAELEVELSMEDSFERYSVNGLKSFEYQMMKDSTDNVEQTLDRIRSIHGQQSIDILKAHYIDGLTLQETADKFNIPYYTLKSWIRRWLSVIDKEA